MDFNEKKLKAEEINGGKYYNAGEYLTAGDFNNLIEGIMHNLSEIDHMKTDPVAPRTVLSGPASNDYGPPAFRTLDPGDLPLLGDFDSRGGNVLTADKGGTGLSFVEANKVLVGKNNTEFETRDITDAPFADDSNMKLVTAKGVVDLLPKFYTKTAKVKVAEESKLNNATENDHSYSAIEIPIARVVIDGDGNEKKELKTLLIQYGKLDDIKGGETRARVKFESSYSDVGAFVTFASVGRSNSEKWGVDVVYVKNEEKNQIKLTKDHYHDCFDYDIFWMTIGLKE